MMGQFCALNIQSDYATVLFVKKNRKLFTVIDQQTIDLSELSELLKNKKDYYISIEQDEVIDEKISLQSLIKNDSVIKNSILRKLNESLHSKQIIFNYLRLPNNKNDETTTYQIDGVYENEYLKSLRLINNWDMIKSSTTNKFSLFSISKQCMTEESYFSIHTYSDKITILAIHKDILIFSRLNTIIANNAETRQMNMVDEITQTIAYVQQQFRDIEFSLIALSGSIGIDDVIPEHIFMSSNLRITVLYPNTFVSGFTDEEPQHYIFALGSWFIPKKFQFLPNIIFARRQYNLFSKILLVASTIIVLSILSFTYEKFNSYSTLLENYETIKDKLVKIAHHTDTYSKEELKKSLKHIQMAEKYLQYHPSDMTYSLKALIELQKPETLHWRYLDDNLLFDATFKKSFNSLNSLYQFEKKFYKEFKNMDSNFTNKYSTQTDYTKMIFYTVVSIENNKEIQPEQTRRKRR